MPPPRITRDTLSLAVLCVLAVGTGATLVLTSQAKKAVAAAGPPRAKMPPGLE